MNPVLSTYGAYLLPATVQMAWAVRLWKMRLVRRYPSLFLYLTFSTISAIVVLTAHWEYEVTGRKEIYAWFYMLSQPLGWTLLLCVVVEVFQRMLASYEGLYRLGRLAMYGFIGGVTVVLCVVFLLDRPDGAGIWWWKWFWFRQERTIYVGLTLISLFLAWFGVYFGLQGSRNVRVVFLTFGLLFTGQASLLTLMGSWRESFVGAWNLIVPILHGVCFLVGALAFTQSGETMERQTVPGISNTGKQMLRELENFNQILLRVLKS